MTDPFQDRPAPGSHESQQTTVFDESPLGDVRQRDLYAYWKACRGDRRLPSRRDIDPVDFPYSTQTLPWVLLTEVHRQGDGLRFRRRLVGTGIITKIGRDTTGLWFEDIYGGDHLRELHAAYADVVALCLPVLQRGQVPIVGKDFLTLERLDLPLAADGETVDMILSLLRYDPSSTT